MRAAKVDTTAKALRKYAESIGFSVVTINGVVDSLLTRGERVWIVDWKSPGGTLTPDQVRLVARGIPIKFITRPEQLDDLKADVFDMRGPQR